MRWLVPSPKTDERAARTELARILDDYLFTLKNRDAGSRGPSASVFEIDVLSTVRRHEMTLSPEVIGYVKALVTANSVIFEVAPDFDLQKTENLFFGHMMWQETQELMHPQKAMALVFEYGYRIRRALDGLSSMPRSGEGSRRLVTAVRRRLLWLAGLMLVFTGALGLVFYAKSTSHLNVLSSLGSWLPFVIFGCLMILVFAIIHQSRRLVLAERSETGAQQELGRRWRTSPQV
jgi:hypothetical protein